MIWIKQVLAQKEKRNKVLFWLLFIIGAMLRLGWLGIVPDGGALNQDEAFGGYEAWSLLHYGIDSHGYAWPVYLVTWGSGMSALNSYLMIPFIAVFGLTPVAIRLPQAIVSCASLYVVYRLLKEHYSDCIALVGLGILAVVPWHIMLGRWGLDCNLLPGFMLFGLYFALKGIEKSKYFLLAGLLYGMSLYCYATVWPVMPIIVVGMMCMILIYKKGHVDKWFWLGLLLLALLAIPLILFCLVNYDIIPECKLGFLSIPKLTARRSVEIKTHTWEWKRNFLDAMQMFIKADDGNPWNSIPRFGLYYKGGLVLAVIGLAVMLVRTLRNPKVHLLDIGIMIQGFAGCVLASLISTNFNRVNVIHIPIVYCMVQGICFVTVTLWKSVKTRWSKACSIGISVVAVAFYLTSLVLFLHAYTGEYNAYWRKMYHRGLNQAVLQAEKEKSSNGTIYVTDVLYPKLLVAARYPTNQFADTVVYREETAEFLDPESFTGYHMGDMKSGMQKPGDVMVCGTWNEDVTTYLDSLGYDKHIFEDYALYIVQ